MSAQEEILRLQKMRKLALQIANDAKGKRKEYETRIVNLTESVKNCDEEIAKYEAEAAKAERELQKLGQPIS